jgi:hypothetical protein
VTPLIKWVAVLGLASGALAQQPIPTVMLNWDKSDDPNTKGYAVFLGTNSNAYTMIIDAGQSNVLTLCLLKKYYARVKAYAVDGTYGPASPEFVLTPAATPIPVASPKASALPTATPKPSPTATP